MGLWVLFSGSRKFSCFSLVPYVLDPVTRVLFVNFGYDVVKNPPYRWKEGFSCLNQYLRSVATRSTINLATCPKHAPEIG